MHQFSYKLYKLRFAITLVLTNTLFVFSTQPLCTVQTLQTMTSYQCGSSQRDTFTATQLPSNFNGATQAVFGFWFQNVFEASCVTSAGGQGLIFKVTYDTTNTLARVPSVYQTITNNQQVLSYEYHPQLSPDSSNSIQITPSIAANNWYYIVSVVDTKLNVFYLYIYDPTVVVDTISSGIISQTTLTYSETLQRAYQSTDTLVFGSDTTSNSASSTISYPSIIIGRTISTDSEIMLMAYSLQNDPRVTIDLFGIGITNNVYDYYFLNNILDTTSTIPSSSDFGTLDGTAKSSTYSVWSNTGIYQTVQLQGTSQTLLLSPSTDFSFIDSLGFISFGIRIVFKMNSLSFPTSCSHHWLLRRVKQTTGEVMFGVGVQQDGTVVVSFGSDIASGTTTKFITTGQWITLKLGCFSRGFTNRILCIFLTGDGLDQTGEEVWIPYASTSPYSADTVTDIILLGGSACGSSSIYTLMINKGFTPERMNSCRWGCSISPPTSSVSTWCPLVADFSNTCAAGGTKIASRTECIKCPIGCASCAVIEFITMKLACKSCISGLVLSTLPSDNAAPSTLETVCACSSAGTYIDVSTATCKPRTIITASLNHISGTLFQFMLSFSSTPTDISTLSSILQPRITVGDYPSSANPTMTLVNNEYFIINFSPNNPIEPGTTLSIVEITRYNALIYNPYMLSPQTLSYVFPSSPATTASPQLSNSTSPEIYGPRHLTIAISILTVIFGMMGSSALPLLKILINIMLFKFINVTYPPNFKEFIVSYIGHGFFFPNIFGSVESNAALVPSSTNGQFQHWNISVVFLQSAGSLLIKEIFCGSCALISLFLHLLCLNALELRELTQKMINIFCWNVTLCYLIADFAEIMLYSIINIQEGSTLNRL